VSALWTAAEATQTVTLLGRTISAFPLIMWLASLVVAYLTVNNLVLRHLSRLSRRRLQRPVRPCFPFRRPCALRWSSRVVISGRI